MFQERIAPKPIEILSVFFVVKFEFETFFSDRAEFITRESREVQLLNSSVILC